MENNIYKKIFNVMKNVEYMAKDGDVEFKSTKYKYLSAEKIVSNIRKEMIKEGLIIYPEKVEITNQNINEKDILVTYVIADTEGNKINIQVAGGGYDTTDKKTYKALTGAYKYALRQTFMIETGDDDPDKEPSKIKDAPTTSKKEDPDIKLKRELMKKYNGNVELAKAEYEEIKQREKQVEEVEEPIEYLEEKFGAQEELI